MFSYSRMIILMTALWPLQSPFVADSLTSCTFFSETRHTTVKGKELWSEAFTLSFHVSHSSICQLAFCSRSLGI